MYFVSHGIPCVMKDFVNSLTQIIKQQIDEGKYEAATDSWSELENVIISSSNSVVYTNLLSIAHSIAPVVVLVLYLSLYILFHEIQLNLIALIRIFTIFSWILEWTLYLQQQLSYLRIKSR